ncbi:hypothetical protein RSOLAG1IB_01091 [Rhizoctonia solani AG-1 IB]|uniref:Zn(2)-C6 fungal-type domain-containing protein n=1 Tax=Thanatephorus cucumeris (strain AG1-IB / isolate 7/3/14) TaxID=1108050 RepID=A0A0B7FFX8_THACB|nr:hypothetical protein RSOLAG1IB_01091 [Rhizoctonia solani AG-1 IB]
MDIRSVLTRASSLQRSKNGCMTCRRKRKKCDENWPLCSRCERAKSQCIWAPPFESNVSTTNLCLDQLSFQVLSYLPNVEKSIVVNPDLTSQTSSSPSNVVLESVTDDIMSPHLALEVSKTRLSPHSPDSTDPDASSQTLFFPTSCIADSLDTHFRPYRIKAASTSSGLLKSRNVRTRGWEHVQDFAPRVIWPPECLDDSDTFDPEGAISVLQRSVVILNEAKLIDPVFQEICDFYAGFLSRIIYHYGLVSSTLVRWMLPRYRLSGAAKHGMLATVVLIRSYYERSVLVVSLRERAKELYSHAIHELSCELENIQLSPRTKLAGLIDIMNYEYYAGHLSNYYAHGAQAAHLVKVILGSDTIDLLNLRGEQAFDLCCFVWCDILDSMSTSRPTRFKYISDLEHVTQVDIGPDSGIEWIYGCPNVLAVLLARTTALRHAQLSNEEAALQGSELAQMIRTWQFRRVEAIGSLLRVSRIAAQEIWRHAAILYVHHAILKSDSSQPFVKDSVKNIIKLASTLKPGVTPDCFLAAPYFIAGTFAVSQKDRYTLRSRLMSCGNGGYLWNLARTLDELWKESDATGRLTSWSESETPRVVL